MLLPPSHTWVVSYTNPCKFRHFLTVVKSFPYEFKGSNCFQWIKKRFEPHNAQRNILQQFENVQIYKGLYGKPLKLDWVARVDFLTQIVLIFGGRCDRYFWDIRQKIYSLPYFNMLFQFLLTKRFESELFLCLQKVDHVIKLCKRPIAPGSVSLPWIDCLCNIISPVFLWLDLPLIATEPFSSPII